MRNVCIDSYPCAHSKRVCTSSHYGTPVPPTCVFYHSPSLTPLLTAPSTFHSHHPPPAILQSWPDRREPSALRAAARLSNGGKADRDTPIDDDDDDDDGDLLAPCDVRLLFVSGTGLNAAARGGPRNTGNDNGGLHLLPGGGGDENNGGDGGTTQGAGMWGVLGRELWRPWPQADVVVHTGSQVSYST